MFTITTNSPEQTSLLGEKIANLIQDNLIICLEGDLGAGKTLFTLNGNFVIMNPLFAKHPKPKTSRF